MRNSILTPIVVLGIASLGCNATGQEHQVHVVKKAVGSTDGQETHSSVEIMMENGEVRAIVDGRELSPEEVGELTSSGEFAIATSVKQDSESRPPRAMLGIRIAQSERGVLVAEAVKGTPAQKAGLREGDLILKINGKDATSEGLSRMIAQSAPGKTMNLVVARGDAQEKMKVRLARWNDARMNPDANDRNQPRRARVMDENDIQWHGDSGAFIIQGEDGMKFIPGDDDERRVHTEVMIELDGDEDFDEEMIQEMIFKQLMEQGGGELDERMIERIMEMAMGGVHRGMERRRHGDQDDEEHDRQRWRDHEEDRDRREFDRRRGERRGTDRDQRHQSERNDGRNNRSDRDGDVGRIMEMVQERMNHMHRGLEEELGHVFREMNERFNEGGEMFGRAMEEMQKQFHSAGEQIHQHMEHVGDAMQRMHEEREHMARALEDALRQQQELFQRIDRLESMIDRMMQGQQPHEQQDRDRPQRSPRRRGSDNPRGEI